ncbi:sigma 54-interacting transcriptional regulator [Aneurinibacillus terranovensis]|uniref:sigma 54-interacting transcriptional regulator n=1 Tax=Aneurinibacillus terranovensis TaxID=278991 RepID=UPI0004047FCC|nr:sigma 54-interacting transcriptional regulator [Aneurinibacillus terranovensis]
MIQPGELPQILNTIPFGLVFIDSEQRIVFHNDYTAQLFSFPQAVTHQLLGDIFPHLSKELEDVQEAFFNFAYTGHDFFVYKVPSYSEDRLTGFLLIFQRMNILDQLVQETDLYKNLALDLNTILETTFDVIYVSDGNGITLRVSSACESLWGYSEKELVGKSVFELEREGVYNPSVTRLVLEQRKKVTITQTTKTGKRLMAMGIPLFDEKKKIIRVVNASRDITEVSLLQEEIEMLKQATEGYREEIRNLRTKNGEEDHLVFQDEKMRMVVHISERVAKVDSPVLITGEPGVGKEFIARLIHRWGEREENPFLTMNCRSIPESMFERELFGAENSEHVHYGVIELASGGTLFLDEIECLPVSIQSKLLQVIQEKRLTRAGSFHVLPVNVRLITATEKDLQQMANNGTFRRDLFYQLNIVPIHIPPLRERKEDIIPLILLFLKSLNQKYGQTKKFKPKLLKVLQSYTWPGNVRELKNIVERLWVTSEGPWIGFEHLPEHMAIHPNQKAIIVNRVVPLQEATESLEMDLLRMALEKYKSTTKIAEVLGVNQSTISRKLQKYGLPTFQKH